MIGNDSVIKRLLADEAATTAIASQLAARIKPGMVIYLCGDLGAGKTTLVRALLNALGYHGRVKSPTFTLLEHYQVAGLHLRHFDLYRFNSPEEWQQAGFRDEFDERNICLVEWPEKAQGLVPAADIIIMFEILFGEQSSGGNSSGEHSSGRRKLEIRALTQSGLTCLNTLPH